MRDFLGSISIGVNWLTGGRPWTPLCYRWHEARRRCLLCRVACHILESYEPGHCRRIWEKYREAAADR